MCLWTFPHESKSWGLAWSAGHQKHISRIEVMRNCRGNRFSQKQMKGLKYEGSPTVGTVLGKNLIETTNPNAFFISNRRSLRNWHVIERCKQSLTFCMGTSQRIQPFWLWVWHRRSVGAGGGFSKSKHKSWALPPSTLENESNVHLKLLTHFTHEIKLCHAWQTLISNRRSLCNWHVIEGCKQSLTFGMGTSQRIQPFSPFSEPWMLRGPSILLQPVLNDLCIHLPKVLSRRLSMVCLLCLNAMALSPASMTFLSAFQVQ